MDTDTPLPTSPISACSAIFIRSCHYRRLPGLIHQIRLFYSFCKTNVSLQKGEIYFANNLFLADKIFLKPGGGSG